MKRSLLVLAVPLFIFILSCERGSSSKESPEPDSEKSYVRSSNMDEDVTPDDRKIIRKGDIKFETADITQTKDTIERITRELGGFISSETANEYNDRKEQVLMIRVPAGNFDLLAERITNTAKRIDRRNISSGDVTEEFIDVEARLKTRKEIESRYLELLKKAGTVEDMLAIERETGRVREEIETTEGRLRYLKDKVSFSSLTVTFYERTSSKFGFGSKFSQSLTNGWKTLLWFLIAITSLWPFILILAGILGWTWIARKKKKGS